MGNPRDKNQQPPRSPSRRGIHDDAGQITAERWTLSREHVGVLLDALNVRALDRQADFYGDGMADAAADIYRALTGEEPDEAESLPAEQNSEGDARFGEIELTPFSRDPDTDEAPEGVHRLDRLPDGTLFEDAEGRLFNVVRQGPTQGSTEIVDDDETHAYYDCGALVKLHEER